MKTIMQFLQGFSPRVRRERESARVRASKEAMYERLVKHKLRNAVVRLDRRYVDYWIVSLEFWPEWVTCAGVLNGHIYVSEGVPQAYRPYIAILYAIGLSGNSTRLHAVIEAMNRVPLHHRHEFGLFLEGHLLEYMNALSDELPIRLDQELEEVIYHLKSLR